ncbi:hypothetical protein [Maribacter sp. ACAM166]|uniref:hypothetical protein n=1 Tax=Maribacter sp. ACAM166 TaxID=2508996 RepID=UPI0010FE5844|nr:hypothetical protein [Maribacter sp. ACAM166]TLP82303.1 hypothetical protein ES765_02395 [Maribacter sp. ACAM166]
MAPSSKTIFQEARALNMAAYFVSSLKLGRLLSYIKMNNRCSASKATKNITVLVNQFDSYFAQEGNLFRDAQDYKLDTGVSCKN